MNQNNTKLNDGTFDWVKDTSKKSHNKISEEGVGESDNQTKEKKKTTNKQQSKPTKDSALGKKVFVHYKASGDIVSMMEAEMSTKNPFLNVPAAEKVAEFTLTGDLSQKSLIEIHNNYKIDMFGKKPKLISKGK